MLAVYGVDELRRLHEGVLARYGCGSVSGRFGRVVGSGDDMSGKLLLVIEMSVNTVHMCESILNLGDSIGMAVEVACTDVSISRLLKEKAAFRLPFKFNILK